MGARPKILVVDDDPTNVDILKARLKANDYHVIEAFDGEEALQQAKKERPDLILLDVMMPRLDGFEVCQRVRADQEIPFIPIILVTAKTGTEEIVKGLEVGADDYLTKPVNHLELLARVKSMLRIKEMHQRIEEQAAQLLELNRTLEARVQQQVEELQRISRLKRYFSPQLAASILSQDADSLLKNHRREITVVFLDLRGFSAFAESAEPEEVMDLLREYHEAMGTLIFQFEGTLERFTGDGIMVFFNDPLPCEDHAEKAVRMAVAMRDRGKELQSGWAKRGYDLALGIGIASGYATLGSIGFAGRVDYAAIGTVTNLAARLCGEARGGQILINQRTFSKVEGLVDVEPLGNLHLKGFSRPIAAFNIVGVKGGGIRGAPGASPGSSGP